jgi:hypothetical protein
MDGADATLDVRTDPEPAEGEPGVGEAVPEREQRGDVLGVIPPVANVEALPTPAGSWVTPVCSSATPAGPSSSPRYGMQRLGMPGM